MFQKLRSILSRLLPLAALVVTVVSSAFSQNPARQALDKRLATYGPAVKEGEILEATSPALSEAFPRYSFFILRFRMYPVARRPEPPLTANNIFIVKPDNSIDLVTDSAALQKFVTGALARVESGRAAENAAKSWLRLVQELRQDGFFKFNEPTVSVPVMSRDLPPSNIRITGTVTVMPANGDMGEIGTTLVFERGRLASVTDRVDLKKGIRPICQATKLLDPDPIVRGMAEQSILVMGQSARAYLEEQRAIAAPDLQLAIDRMWQRILDEGR